MTAGSANGSANGAHPLQHTWELYLHYPSYSSGEAYSSEAYKKLCEFDTVEGFWRYFSFVPTPSDVFTCTGPDGSSVLVKRKLDGKSLEAIGLFKKGVKPEWEDDTNKLGGHWECRRPFDLATLDRLWSNIVLGLIGETLEGGAGGVITGARVVDKSKNTRPEYRLELWTKTKDAATNQAIRDRLLEALSADLRGEAPLDLSWKDHADALDALPQAAPTAAEAGTSRPGPSSLGSAGKELLMAAMGLGGQHATTNGSSPAANGSSSGADRPPSS